MSSGTAGPPQKRVRHVINNPNPLFVQWLREWKDEAAKAGTHAKNTYMRALQSLSKFPIPLASGKDCMILKHFGQKICDMLDKKLIEHRKLHPDWRPQAVAVPAPASTGSALRDAKIRRAKKDSSRHQQGTSSDSAKDPLEIINPMPTNHMVSTSATMSAQPAKNKHASLTSLKINRRVQSQITNLEQSEPLAECSRPGPNVNTNGKSQNTVNEVVPSPSQRLDMTTTNSCTADVLTNVKLSQGRPVSPKPPEIIDLCMDSPDRKRASDDDDSFLVPLSKRLAVGKTNWEAKYLQQSPTTEQRPPALSPPQDHNNDINFIDAYCNDDDDDDCLVLEERLVALKELVRPVLARESPSPEPESGLPQVSLKQFNEMTKPVESEPVENALSQEDSFCPARSLDTVPQESILDISAEIRQKRLSFLARLEASTPRAETRHKPSISDMLDSPLTSPKDHYRLSTSSYQNTQCSPVAPASSAVDSQRGGQEKPLAKVHMLPKAVCILAEPASMPEKEPTALYPLSDSDDDLPPLALRVNRQPLMQFSPKESSTASEQQDSFAALVEGIETPPVARVNRTEQQQRHRLPDPLAAASTNGVSHKLKVTRKKRAKTADDDTGGISSATAAAENRQPKRNGRPKKDKTASLPVSVQASAPLRLEYVPEGSGPARPIETAFSSRTSRCPLAVTFLPGTFEVILCIDSCEATGGVTSKNKTAMIEALRNSGVSMDIRKMNVGDFAWIAKRDSDKDELVLDCIVERKRTDDLASSIKDGRYREQKHRLVTCGLRRKVYLIEEYNRFAAGGISDLALLQAQLNTQVINDFVIKRTRNVKESAQYLATLTRSLAERYEHRTLKSCLRDEVGQLSDNHLMSWNEFNESSTKRRKVCTKQVFTRSLMVLKGMSLEKALAIVALYPTIVLLIAAYEQCEDRKQRETLLADIRCTISGRRIGPALSKAVYKFISGEQT